MSVNFIPKKPVKSFMDLEVYQKLLECAVFVAKYVAVPLPKLPDIAACPIGTSSGSEPSSETEGANGPRPEGRVATSAPGRSAADMIFRNMLPCALGLPHLIAEAHSVRFGGKKDCLILLERAMLNCNKMAVYLEEARDIAETGVPSEKFNELIKKYLYIRQKILNLQRSWKKYMSEA